jgi:hypothetical protein
MEKDAKDRATKRLRTINVQLKDIVRADLLTEIVDDERTDEVREKSAKREMFGAARRKAINPHECFR